MRLISFMWFKQNCKHYDEELSADLDRPICINCWNKADVILVDKWLKAGKCSEKSCPVLQQCKEEK